MAPVQRKVHPWDGVVRSLVLWDGLVGCVRLDRGSDLFSWAGFGLRVIVGISLIYFLGPGHPVGRFAVQPHYWGFGGLSRCRTCAFPFLSAPGWRCVLGEVGGLIGRELLRCCHEVEQGFGLIAACLGRIGGGQQTQAALAMPDRQGGPVQCFGEGLVGETCERDEVGVLALGPVPVTYHSSG